MALAFTVGVCLVVAVCSWLPLLLQLRLLHGMAVTPLGLEPVSAPPLPTLLSCLESLVFIVQSSQRARIFCAPAGVRRIEDECPLRGVRCHLHLAWNVFSASFGLEEFY